MSAQVLELLDTSVNNSGTLTVQISVEVILCRGRCCTHPDLFRLVPEIVTCTYAHIYNGVGAHPACQMGTEGGGVKLTLIPSSG